MNLSNHKPLRKLPYELKKAYNEDTPTTLSSVLTEQQEQFKYGSMVFWTGMVLFALITFSPATIAQKKELLQQTSTLHEQQFVSRIIGGSEVLTAIPYVAMLIYQGANSRYYGCAGTLVAPTKVITAGHCVDDRVPVEIIIGRAKVSDSDGESHGVASISIHPRFNVGTLENDLAVITLDQPSIASPLPIATKGMLANLTYDSELKIHGWGYTDPRFLYPSNTLKEAIVRYIPKYVCNSSLFYDKIIGPGMICAGFIEGETDSCGGDSGGPLTFNFNQSQYLLGLVSWGASAACAQAHRPGVYTDLTYFNAWVEQEIYEQKSLPNLLRHTPQRSSTIGVGDLDDDGIDEILSIHGNKLVVTSNGSSRVVLKLKRTQLQDNTLKEQRPKIDLVDIDGDHKDEIVLTTNRSIHIYSLRDLGALTSNSDLRHAFTIRKILLPQTSAIIDSKWGRILSPDKAQLALLTTRKVIILTIDLKRAKVESTTKHKGGKSLLIGSVNASTFDSIFVFDGNIFKNIPLRTNTELAISSKEQNSFQAPQSTFFYDVDDDGTNELLSLNVSGDKTSLISIARFDGLKFGQFTAWFEVPRGSVLSL